MGAPTPRRPLLSRNSLFLSFLTLCCVSQRQHQQQDCELLSLVALISIALKSPTSKDWFVLDFPPAMAAGRERLLLLAAVLSQDLALFSAPATCCGQDCGTGSR